MSVLKLFCSQPIGDNNKLASRLYGVYRSQSIKLMRFDIHADKSEIFEDLAIRALNIMTQATKKEAYQFNDRLL